MDIAQEVKVPSALIEFIKNKAIERHYHTFFSWKDRNANAE